MILCAIVQMVLLENVVTEGKTHAPQIPVKLVELAGVKDLISSVSAHLSEKASFVSWSVVMCVMGTLA
jgi:hypothetical protein